MNKVREEITICILHQEKIKVPLISTFAFSGAEYWCPYCGQTEGLFGGDQVKSTAILRRRDEAYKKLSYEYLNALSTKVCSTIVWQGKTINPKDLPQEEKERLQKHIEHWKYNQQV